MRFRYSIDITNWSLKEIEDMIMSNNGYCVQCENPIRENSIMSYDHDGGILVRGFELKQWIYFRCSHCGYDSSIQKVLNRIVKENLDKIQNRRRHI